MAEDRICPLTSVLEANKKLLSKDEYRILKRWLFEYWEMEESIRPPDNSVEKEIVRMFRGKETTLNAGMKAYLKLKALANDMSEQTDAESIRNIDRERKQKLVSEKKKTISKDVILKKYSEGRPRKKPKAATKSTNKPEQTRPRIERLVTVQKPGTKPISEPDYKQFIDEPLGSREDFKKDRASWKRTNS
jgi:hypothetical protein